MKNIIKLFTLLIATSLFVYSCGDDEKVVDTVLDGTINGGILRTLSTTTPVINSSDPSSSFTVEVEEQDVQDGALLESVEVRYTFSDQTPENGVTVVDSELLWTLTPEDFTTDTPFGLPRTTITVTYGDMAAAGGLNNDNVLPGDRLIIELYLNLTDGSRYGPDNAAGVITGGFFASPFQYSTFITCSPAPGDYTVVMFDSYGDGWQTTDSGAGDGLICTIDGVENPVAMCSLWGEYDFECAPGDFEATQIVTVPEGAESAEWVFTGDFYGEISFDIYGPSGNLLYDSGEPGAAPVGTLLPVVECASN